MAPFQSTLLPLAAAVLIGACSSVDVPFVGDSTANDSTESAPAWLEESQGNAEPNAQEPAGSVAQTNGQGGANGAGIAETSFDPGSVWNIEVAERLDRLEAATGSLATELRTLNRQIGTLAANGAASESQLATTNEVLAGLVGPFEDYGSALENIQTEIANLASSVGATDSSIGELRTDLRNVSSSVSGSVTPAVELGLGKTGGWFKTTLITVVLGFACIGYFLWRSSQRAAQELR